MPSPTEITVAQLSRRIGLPDSPAVIDVRTEGGEARTLLQDNLCLFSIIPEVRALRLSFKLF